MADDKDTPTRPWNREQAEGGRWTSDPDTVEDADEDVVARTNRHENTPRRFEEGVDDEVMPSDDAPVGTKI